MPTIPYTVAAVYIGFFALIGVALWVTKDPWCLAALVFAPRYKEGGKDE